MTDDDLIHLIDRIRQRDLSALALFDSQLRPSLWHWASNILRNDADTDEAVSWVMEKVWSRADLYQPDRGPPKPWLKTIVENHCKDMLDRRRKGGRSELEQEWMDDDVEGVPAQSIGAFTYVIGADAYDNWLWGAEHWVGKQVTLDGRMLRFLPEHGACMRVMVEKEQGSTPVLIFNVDVVARKLQLARSTVQDQIHRIGVFLEHGPNRELVMEGFIGLWQQHPEIRTVLYRLSEPGTA